MLREQNSSCVSAFIVTDFSFPGLVFAKEKAFSCASTDLDEFQIYTIYTLSWNFKWHEIYKSNESDFGGVFSGWR